MIPAAMITEWSQQCPWISLAQVEQDLVLSRALVEIYRIPALRDSLVFRGGTALHKLVLQPAARYSEDLDFVQIREESIGQTLDLLRSVLEPWLGNPKTDISPRGATQIYRFESETPPVIRLRLKIEINTREHFHLHPLQNHDFTVASRWFNGTAQVPIYSVTELLGTKLRALYQRRKGRDLFDLWHAHQFKVLNPAEVVAVFLHYMEAEQHSVTQTVFRSNLEAKMNSKAFLSDTPPLLRSGVEYEPHEAFDFINVNLLTLL
ncbi:MAG: nucleotidyl transferase AbiEii/AbiGii toxin family protein [Terrimicrobiaceae bacterium]